MNNVSACEMELAVRPPYMQGENVSDLTQELMLSGTPTLPQRTMGKKVGGNWKKGILGGGVQQRRNIREEI